MAESPLPERSPVGWRPNSAQLTIATSIAVLATAGIVYRFVHHSWISQASIFYIGLPALMAIGLVLTNPAKSITGTIMKVLSIGLLTAPIVLNEGVICVILAAPLFYLVGACIGLIADAGRRPDGQQPRNSALLLIPLVVLMSEGASDATTLPAAERVTAVRTVVAKPVAVQAAMAATPCFERAPRPWTLRAFPQLDRVSGHGLRVGDERRMAFSSRHAAGELVLRVASAGSGQVRFTVAADSSPMAHWWGLREVRVRWRSDGGQRTRVTWTFSYVRLLAPAGYFGPVERVAAKATAGYLITAVATPHGC